MKYPTCEYRKLLCLYQQLQRPEPALFSRPLREHHLLLLSSTPTLVLYFIRLEKRYWLVNEKDCLGLKAFRHPAGEPGHFFTRSLKNTLSVKLHRLLDNNAAALSWFIRALIREVCQLFDIAANRLSCLVPSGFTFYRTITVKSKDLMPPARRDIFAFCREEHEITLTLRQDGFGCVKLDLVIHYRPLPFFHLTKHYVTQQDGVSHCLTSQNAEALKSLIAPAVSDFVHTFFIHKRNQP